MGAISFYNGFRQINIVYTVILSFIPICVNGVLSGINWYVIIMLEVTDMYDRAGIANRLFIARKNKNLKQNDVCKIIGINQSSYSALESGKRDMTVPELVILSDLLDVPMLWIVGEDSIPQLTDSECLDVEKYKRFIISIRNK